MNMMCLHFWISYYFIGVNRKTRISYGRDFFMISNWHFNFIHHTGAARFYHWVYRRHAALLKHSFIPDLFIHIFRRGQCQVHPIWLLLINFDDSVYLCIRKLIVSDKTSLPPRPSSLSLKAGSLLLLPQGETFLLANNHNWSSYIPIL